MSDFKLKADILRALADGKKVYIRDVDCTISLTEHGFVNQHDVRVALMFGSPLDEYSLHREPNPHPKGSYMWAYEEACRGNAVTRRDEDWLFESAEEFAYSDWCHSDFIATDWEHV